MRFFGFSMRKVSLKPGIIKEVIRVVKIIVEKPREALCFLSFDEVKLGEEGIVELSKA